jgi:hypothetical protein
VNELMDLSRLESGEAPTMSPLNLEVDVLMTLRSVFALDKDRISWDVEKKMPGALFDHIYF